MGGMFRRTVGWGVAGVGMFYIILVCFGMFLVCFGYVLTNDGKNYSHGWYRSPNDRQNYLKIWFVEAGGGRGKTGNLPMIGP
jgi:hypothetical protein